MPGVLTLSNPGIPGASRPSPELPRHGRILTPTLVRPLKPHVRRTGLVTPPLLLTQPLIHHCLTPDRGAGVPDIAQPGLVEAHQRDHGCLVVPEQTMIRIATSGGTDAPAATVRDVVPGGLALSVAVSCTGRQSNSSSSVSKASIHTNADRRVPRFLFDPGHPPIEVPGPVVEHFTGMPSADYASRGMGHKSHTDGPCPPGRRPSRSRQVSRVGRSRS